MMSERGGWDGGCKMQTCSWAKVRLSVSCTVVWALRYKVQLNVECQKFPIFEGTRARSARNISGLSCQNPTNSISICIYVKFASV